MAKKWIQSILKKPGSLSKQMGIPEKENIPVKKLKKAVKRKTRKTVKKKVVIRRKKKQDQMS